LQGLALIEVFIVSYSHFFRLYTLNFWHNEVDVETLRTSAV